MRQYAYPGYNTLQVCYKVKRFYSFGALHYHYCDLKMMILTGFKGRKTHSAGTTEKMQSNRDRE